MIKSNKDWTARLSADGKIFCSPACGCGCTKEDHEKAVDMAEQIAERLGDKWTPIIWENAGWRWKIVNGCAEIRSYRVHGEDETFMCKITLSSRQKSIQFMDIAKSPEYAFRLAMHRARTFIADFSNALNEVSLNEAVVNNPTNAMIDAALAADWECDGDERAAVINIWHAMKWAEN